MLVQLTPKSRFAAQRPFGPVVSSLFLVRKLAGKNP